MQLLFTVFLVWIASLQLHTAVCTTPAVIWYLFRIYIIRMNLLMPFECERCFIYHLNKFQLIGSSQLEWWNEYLWIDFTQCIKCMTRLHFRYVFDLWKWWIRNQWNVLKIQDKCMNANVSGVYRRGFNSSFFSLFTVKQHNIQHGIRISTSSLIYRT